MAGIESSSEQMLEVPYYQAASFSQEPLSLHVFQEINDMIFDDAGLGLSVLRLKADPNFIVTVLGENPPLETREAINDLLNLGERTLLDATILSTLIARRQQANAMGVWVERHFNSNA